MDTLQSNFVIVIYMLFCCCCFHTKSLPIHVLYNIQSEGHKKATRTKNQNQFRTGRNDIQSMWWVFWRHLMLLRVWRKWWMVCDMIGMLLFKLLQFQFVCAFHKCKFIINITVNESPDLQCTPPRSEPHVRQSPTSSPRTTFCPLSTLSTALASPAPSPSTALELPSCGVPPRSSILSGHQTSTKYHLDVRFLWSTKHYFVTIMHNLYVHINTKYVHQYWYRHWKQIGFKFISTWCRNQCTLLDGKKYKRSITVICDICVFEHSSREA